MDKEVIAELTDSLKKVQEHFAGELNKLRTGRAHPSMIDGVMVEAYGVQTPLIQLATISTPEPQLIQISPFDPTTLEPISSAIRNNQSLGLNPVDDGRLVRIQIPTLTTGRRQQIVKQLGEKQEEAHIGVRKARQSAVSTVDKSKKAKEISEDDAKRLQKQIDDAISAGNATIDTMTKDKEAEILKV